MGKACVSVSKDLFAKLEKASEASGVSIGKIVEIACSPAIGAPLSPELEQLAAKVRATTTKKTRR